jgi:asparagine N-glycosylation enzyme membrane subunit Stt3
MSKREMGDNLKKIFNNKYTIIFSSLALFVFILSIFSALSDKTGIPQLQSVFYSFSWWNLALLGVMLTGSATFAYFKKFKLMFIPIIIWFLFATIIIRTANISGLKDITTGDYTLGPDLDPFLYLRNAKEILEGTAGKIDPFRYAPLQTTPSYITFNLMPWALVLIYKLIFAFRDISITYAAIIAPVIFFVVSAIGFFLFAKTISSFKFSERKSWVIAVIATALYAVAPQMLHRTTAGIPELESLGMVWFWFAFLFFSLAWKTERKKKWILFGALAGIFTGLMSWTWGGYRYIYLGITLLSFIYFVLEKDKAKNKIIFFSWFIPTIILEMARIKNISAVFSSITDTVLATAVFFIFIVDLILSNPKIREKLKLNKIHLPDSIKSTVIALLLVSLLVLAINPDFFWGAVSGVVERLVSPYGKARVGLTVAENQAPYFPEILSSFGSLFWIFLAGVLVLFYKAVSRFSKKKKWALTATFAIFICAISFNRISPTSALFNGESIPSQLIYLSGIILFAATAGIMYLKAHKNKDEKTLSDFREIDFSILLLLILSFFMIISTRGAIRLVFIICPFIILLSAFFPVQIYESAQHSKDSLSRIILGTLLVVISIALLVIFANYAAASSYESKMTVSSAYNQQWQYAMEWVRENTATGSIFVHWWDYGYWVQSIGERPTVSDGGHYVGYWNHLIARYLLTTHNPNSALSLMKTYNASYLLIDSTDLGKYPAYSKIGGDTHFDTFSIISNGLKDESQTREMQNSTIFVYPMGGVVDEDISIENNDSEILIPGPTYDKFGNPSYKAYSVAVILAESKGIIQQPVIVYQFNEKQISSPVRYLHYNGKLKDFSYGVDAVVQIVPSVTGGASSNINIDERGAVIYLSPKVSKSLFARLYLLDNAFGDYGSINLVHSESGQIVKALKAQGYSGGEFLYYNGFVGPIKIWKPDYPENIVENGGFLDTEGGYAEFDDATFTR